MPASACAAATEHLQRQLDGGVAHLPRVVGDHISGCTDCRARFAIAERFSAALVDSAAALPPALLTERIIARVIASGRRRQWIRRGSLATGMAAGVLFALWVTRPAEPKLQMADGPPPDLRHDITDVGQAVATLTRRAAVGAVDAGRQLVPSVPTPPWPPALAPARPFEDAGAAIADGFEPVATSARRAALLFWHEVPSAAAKVD
jgi:predicted anti-sigma-YlaC factor YlaD